MRYLRRRSFLLISLLLCWTMAGGAAALVPAPPLQGEVVLPEGSDDATCQFIYRYTYPQVDGESDAALGINGFYQYLAEDALSFHVPMEAEHHQHQGSRGTLTVTYQIMYSGDDYLSVLTTTNRALNDTSFPPVYAGHTFALTGEMAGQVISLPYLLGKLSPQETDTWLLDRQVRKSSQVVRTLVWEALTAMDDQARSGWTKEQLESSFFPEEDFFLNESGQLVFYLQPRGTSPFLTTPLSTQAILDEW